MIGEPPLLKVRRRFARPEPADVAAFSGIPTGFVVDAIGGRAGLDGRIKPIGAPLPFPGPFHGVAVTCEAGPADNLAVFGTLDVVMPGDVVVCAADGFEKTAVIGDLLLGMLKNSGVVAFVTDGFVRDLAGIRAVGLPCYAAGITPNSPVRNGPGTVGLPIVAGGTAVAAGDIVVGDEDGVVVVPQARIKEVIAALETVKAGEAALVAKVNGGLRMPDHTRALIAAGRFDEVD